MVPRIRTPTIVFFPQDHTAVAATAETVTFFFRSFYRFSEIHPQEREGFYCYEYMNTRFFISTSPSMDPLQSPQERGFTINITNT